MNGKTGYFYLNLENDWPSVQLDRLVIDPTGALTLARVPGAQEPISLDLGGPGGAAGVAVNGEGFRYLTDPAENRMLKIDPYLPERVLVLGAEGSLPGQFHTPRGLALGWPEAIYVADSGNHRIQIFDRHTLQLRGVWGQPDPYAEPQPSNQNGRFNDPWDLAADSSRNIYIVDHGNHRIQKFDWQGRVMPAFWDRLSGDATLDEPTHIAVDRKMKRGETGRLEPADLIYLVDRARREVMVLSPEGDFLSSWGSSVFGEPAGIAILGEAVYVGDNLRKRVLKFLAADWSFIGEARGFEGSVAGLGVDPKGNLWVHPGQADQATRLELEVAWVPQGSFLAGPMQTEEITTLWHRIRVDADSLPENTHLQLYSFTSDASSPPPYERESVNPFANDAWQSIPRDTLDALIPSIPAVNTPQPASPSSASMILTGGTTKGPLLSQPARFLWIGGQLQSDGGHSPVIQQIRVDYGRDTYLRYLPSIYSKIAPNGDFLERFLAFFESIQGGLEDEIASSLPELFDPWAAPESNLSWLAGWLAFDLDEDWTAGQMRQRIAEAFRLQALRGTVEGLRQYLKIYADVEARIEEPALQTSIWSLGETSVLGFSTMLAPAYPDGAVLGVSATLDQSNLSEVDDYGVSLFKATSFQFCVQIHRSELSRPTSLEEVKSIIEREKPAHTDYHLCIVEPRMRVGFQARLGIDTLVAEQPPELELDGKAKWGFARVGSQQETRRQSGGSVGRDAQVGNKLTLT